MHRFGRRLGGLCDSLFSHTILSKSEITPSGTEIGFQKYSAASWLRTALQETEKCCWVSKVKCIIMPNKMAKQIYFLFHEDFFKKRLSMFCAVESEYLLIDALMKATSSKREVESFFLI